MKKLMIGNQAVAQGLHDGGLGVVSFTTLLLIFAGKRIQLKQRLLIQEAYGFDTLTGLVKMVKKMVKGALIVEGFGALLYMIIGLFVYDIIWLRIYGGSCWNKHDRGTGGNENGLLIASFFITIINEVLKGMLGFSLWAASTKA